MLNNDQAYSHKKSFLFVHWMTWYSFLTKTIFGTFIKNSFWLAVAQGANGLANFFMAIYLAKNFGPIAYGAFSYSFAFVMLFATLFDMGLTTAVTKEFSANSFREKDFFLLFLLKCGFGIIAVIFIGIVAFYINKDANIFKIIVCLSLSQFCIQLLNLFFAYFRAKQKMELEAIIRFFYIGCLLLSVIGCMRAFHTISSIASLYALVGGAVVLVVLFYLRNLFTENCAQIRWKVCKKYLKFGVYIAFSQGVSDIMVNTDTFLLGYWGMLKSAGFYTAATKVYAMVLFPMSIISTAIFPILIKALSHSNEKFLQYWQVWMKCILVFSILGAFLIISDAKAWIMLFYGEDYMPAVPVLKILMITTVIVYINNLYYQALLIFERQKSVLMSTILGSVLNVLLNIICIPKFGIEGSAWATAVSQFAYGIFFISVCTKSNICNSLQTQVIKTFFIAIISGMFAWLIMLNINTPLFVSLLSRIAIYFMLYFIFTKLILWANTKNNGEVRKWMS